MKFSLKVLVLLCLLSTLFTVFKASAELKDRLEINSKKIQWFKKKEAQLFWKFFSNCLNNIEFLK